MPFKSGKQRAFLAINKPAVAKKFAEDAKKQAPKQKGYGAAFGETK
jgi:hypothetical protein